MNGLVSFRLCTLSDSDLLKKVDEMTDEIFILGRLPARHIPARPDEDYDLLVGELVKRFHSRIVNSYLLDYDEQRDQEICAVATKYENKKPCRWAIRRGGSCMRKSDGDFIYEPNPSSRDDDFFTECRFDSFEDAERIYLSFHCR